MFVYHIMFLSKQSPVPPDPWTGIFEADTLGNACPQDVGFIQLTNPGWEKVGEDCLHLNIYTPVCNTNYHGYFSTEIKDLSKVALNAPHWISMNIADTPLQILNCKKKGKYCQKGKHSKKGKDDKKG